MEQTFDDVNTDILNQNPPAISSTTKGFVGKFYAESPFLPFTAPPNINNFNNNNLQGDNVPQDNFQQQDLSGGFNNFNQDPMMNNFDNNFNNYNNFGMSNNYYDPNFMFMNPEQLMLQQQMFFNQYMDDIKYKANVEKDRYLEQAYLTGLCYERCVSKYFLNPLDEYDRFKTMEKTTEHLSPKEADCLKDCIYRQKHFMSTILKQVYSKMSPPK